MLKKFTAVVLTALALSVMPMTQSAATGPTDGVTDQVSAHIGTYLGGEKAGNAGQAIGGAIGTVVGIAVGSYIGSSMGPAGTIFWGWRAASAARTLGGIAGAA